MSADDYIAKMKIGWEVVNWIYRKMTGTSSWFFEPVIGVQLPLQALYPLATKGAVVYF
jgi:hypothetical protein